MPLKGDFSILPAMKLQGRPARGQRLEPGQGLLPEAKAEEDRPRQVLPRRRASRPEPRAAAADADAALPGRRGGVVLLPEAGSGESPATGSRPCTSSSRPGARPTSRLQRAGGARLDRQPRLHRPAHVALARGRRRPARLPADRPRPERGQSVAARAEDRARREGRDGRARARRASRRRRARRGSTSSRRSSPSSASRRCGGSRRRWRRRSSGGSATRRWRRRRGRSRTGAASSSTTARTRATGRSPRRTRSGRRPMRARRRRSSWDEVPTVRAGAFTLTTMRKRIDEVGDLTEGHVAPQAKPAAALLEARPGAGRPEQARQRPAPGGRAATLGERPGRLAVPPSAALTQRQEVNRRSGRLGGAADGPRATCSPSGPCPGRKRMNLVPCRKRLRSSLS